MRQTIDDNREDWTDLTRRLEEYKSSIENQIDLVKKYPLADGAAVDEAFSRPLNRYVEYVKWPHPLQCVDHSRLLEEFQSTVNNQMHKRRRSGLASWTEIRKMKIDAGLTRKFNQDLEDRHRGLMVRACPSYS